MECPCGADFCYVCGKPFFGDRSDHYACSSDVTVVIILLSSLSSNKLLAIESERIGIFLMLLSNEVT